MGGPVVSGKPVTAAKAVVAAIGASLTAATTALAVITTAIGDDSVDVQEIGTVTSAVLSLVLTVYGVWKVENTPVRS